MATFEQAASLAARLAVDSIKDQFSPEERLEAIKKAEEDELNYMPRPDRKASEHVQRE